MMMRVDWLDEMARTNSVVFKSRSRLWDRFFFPSVLPEKLTWDDFLFPINIYFFLFVKYGNGIEVIIIRKLVFLNKI
jgi:hypothetical protein